MAEELEPAVEVQVSTCLLESRSVRSIAGHDELRAGNERRGVDEMNEAFLFVQPGRSEDNGRRVARTIAVVVLVTLDGDTVANDRDLALRQAALRQQVIGYGLRDGDIAIDASGHEHLAKAGR